MKRIKFLLIMCGVLVILAVMYIIILTITANKNKKYDDTDTDKPISTTYTAAQIDISSLYSIKYNIDSVKYCYTLNDEATAWQWDSDSALPLDNTYFAAMASTITTILSTVKMTVEQSALSSYGLDTPWLTVTVSDEVYGTQSFFFGDYNSYNEQYYFMTGANANLVYMVDSLCAAPFSYTPRNMVKNDTMPVIREDGIKKLTFKNDTDEWVYTFYSGGKDDDPDTADIWYVSKNSSEETVLDTSVGAGLCEEISSITFSEIAGYSESDKAALGLDAPTTMTVFYTSEKSITDSNGSTSTVNIDSAAELMLGYADGNGALYASLPGSVLTYRIGGELIAGLFNAIISPVAAA